MKFHPLERKKIVLFLGVFAFVIFGATARAQGNGASAEQPNRFCSVMAPSGPGLRKAIANKPNAKTIPKMNVLPSYPQRGQMMPFGQRIFF
jgi:hypothetical protein